MAHNTAPRSRRSRFAILILAVAALALLLAACSSSSKGSSTGSGTAQITVQDFKFNPTTPVKAGATVTVHNNGPSTHTVTADAGGFDVTVDSGKDATFTAPSKAGTYKFHCSIHTQMHGTLTVQ